MISLSSLKKTFGSGVLLFVEVGYKFRLFGKDAVDAAKVIYLPLLHSITLTCLAAHPPPRQALGIYCHRDHAFMTASVPVHRIGVHVRRMVSAGFLVGVVGQTESAAIKKNSRGVSKTFERNVVGLYSLATLMDDEIIGSDASSDTTASGRHYLLVLNEAVEDTGVRLGMVAVSVTSGEILHDTWTEPRGRDGLSKSPSPLLPCASSLYPVVFSRP